MEFPTDDYKRMLLTRHNAALLGIPAFEPWPIEKAAKLMAVVYTFGNNEVFTLSPKFNADREYTQSIYGLDGGEIPNAEFATALKEWVVKTENVKDKTDPLFCELNEWIISMYNFKLIC